MLGDGVLCCCAWTWAGSMVLPAVLTQWIKTVLPNGECSSCGWLQPPCVDAWEERRGEVALLREPGYSLNANDMRHDVCYGWRLGCSRSMRRRPQRRG